MEQEELIIDYTQSNKKTPKYYLQLLFTVIITNIADILFRWKNIANLRSSHKTMTQIIVNFMSDHYDNFGYQLKPIISIVIAFVAFGLMVASTIWVFNIIKKMVGESQLLTITLVISLMYCVVTFISKISIELECIYLIHGFTVDSDYSFTIVSFNYINIGFNVICKILAITSAVLKMFVLVKNKALHRLLLIALIIPAIIVVLSIPIDIIYQVVVTLLRNKEFVKIDLFSDAFFIISLCSSQIFAILVDIFYIIYLAFAMKKTKEVEYVGDGVALGITMYVASCIVALLLLIAIFIVFIFI